jgi:hypothetical protein
MSRSQRAVRAREGFDGQGRTAFSLQEPSRFTPEEQRARAVARGFPVGPAPQDSDLPAVTGTPTPGLTLTCAPGTWDSDGPDTISYEWFRGSASQGAADTVNTYDLTDADAGFPVFCRVESADSIGSSFYDAYMEAGDGLIDARNGPTLLVAPVIDDSDGLALGDSLISGNGTWFGGSITYAYQWFRDGDSIPGANAATHVIVADDSGAVLNAEVTATDATGSTTASSDSVTGA